MPVIRIGEKRINYWAGRGMREGGRTPIVFIHGAGGGQFVWGFQKAFFEKEFHPIILELPGHGDSGGEGEEKIDRYAEHVQTFMEALNLHKAFLVGHSMGGAIVETLALRKPEDLQGIVLVGTGARLRVLPMILEGIKSDFQETIQKITRFAYSRNAPAEMIERGARELSRCPAEVLYGDFLACDRFDLMKEVDKIELPTLILCGNEDELTPVKYSEFLHSRIRGSRLDIIPRAGHMVMMESPEAFNEALRRFLLNPTRSENCLATRRES